MSIELQIEILQRIEELADQENRTPSEIVAEAIQLYSSQKKKMSDIEAPWAIVGIGESEEDDFDDLRKKMSGYEFLSSIAGQGRSGQDDVSARDEEILESEVDPIRGWRLARSDEDSN